MGLEIVPRRRKPLVSGRNLLDREPRRPGPQKGRTTPNSGMAVGPDPSPGAPPLITRRRTRRGTHDPRAASRRLAEGATWKPRRTRRRRAVDPGYRVASNSNTRRLSRNARWRASAWKVTLTVKSSRVPNRKPARPWPGDPVADPACGSRSDTTLTERECKTVGATPPELADAP